jgi:hypothetical protein
MMVELLGPQSIVSERQEIVVPAAKQRTRAAHAGRMVTSDKLADVLWEGT